MYDIFFSTHEFCTYRSLKIEFYFKNLGARGGAVVEVLRYKPEGRGIVSR
jgi:hypothetical protein